VRKPKITAAVGTAAGRGDACAAEKANELTSLHIRPSSGASIVSAQTSPLIGLKLGIKTLEAAALRSCGPSITCLSHGAR
jgi:hypothetical protein